MPFGLLVCGPPGSGKSTFCNGLQHYLTLAGAAALGAFLAQHADASRRLSALTRHAALQAAPPRL